MSSEEMDRGSSAPAELAPTNGNGSESSLSEASGASEGDSDDSFGDNLENMPFAYIRGEVTYYPQSRDGTPHDDGPEGEALKNTIKFPKMVPLELFVTAAEAAEAQSYDEHYRILENMTFAATMWQEEFLINQLQEKQLEKEHPPSKEKNTVAKSYKNPRAPLRPEPDASYVKVADRAFKITQGRQDIIEAQAYGYDHDANLNRLGRQDPRNQRSAGIDGRRTLRQHQPTQKVIDGELSTDEDSDTTGPAGRPRRRVRDISNVPSRLNSEVPEDLKVARFQSGKRKGRPPRDRITQLQIQEGLRGPGSKSPERNAGRVGAGRRGMLLSTEEDDAHSSSHDGSGGEEEQPDRGRRGTSEFESKTSIKNQKQKKKGKQKPFTAKRLDIKRIQMIPLEERTPEEQKSYKNFREKKGAWATRYGKDPEKVLAIFDRDALATDESDDDRDEDNAFQEGAEEVIQATKTKKSAKPAVPVVPKAPSVQPEKKKKQKGAKGETAASRNMLERWRKKKEAERRGDTTVSNIGRYAKKKSSEPIAAPKVTEPTEDETPVSHQPPQKLVQQEAIGGIFTFKVGGYGKKGDADNNQKQSASGSLQTSKQDQPAKSNKRARIDDEDEPYSNETRE